MKDVIFETAFATLTSALHFRETVRDDMEEACDRDHETTANETRKTAISSSEKCSAYLNLEKNMVPRRVYNLYNTVNIRIH